MASVYLTKAGKWRVQSGSGNNRQTKVFRTRREAEAWADHEEKAANLDPTTWQDLSAEYFKSSAYKDKSKKTQPVETRASLPVLACFGKKLVQATTEEDVHNYIELRLEKPSLRTKKQLSGNTVRIELAFLSVLARMAIRKRLIADNPCRRVTKPKCNQKEVRITESERVIIFQKLNENDYWGNINYAYFYLLFNLGCRPSELAELTYKYVNKAKLQIHFEHTKNTRARTVIIPKACQTVFKEWIEREGRPTNNECPYVFPSRTKKDTWRPFDFSNAWKTIKRRIGGLINPAISPHAFRHERISRWFERTDLNEGAIMALSGHITPAALHRYKHIRAEKYRGVVEALIVQEEIEMHETFMKLYANGIPTQAAMYCNEIDEFQSDMV